jgi:hypothetical protein
MCMSRYYVSSDKLKLNLKCSSVLNKFQDFFDKHVFQIEISKVFVDNWTPRVTNRSTIYRDFLLSLEQHPLVKKITIKGYPKFKGVAPRSLNV